MGRNIAEKFVGTAAAKTSKSLANAIIHHARSLHEHRIPTFAGVAVQTYEDHSKLWLGAPGAVEHEVH